MTKALTDPEPGAPDVDENGVDLAQIREMLDLSPAERLAFVTEFLNSLLSVRDRNEGRGSP